MSSFSILKSSLRIFFPTILILMIAAYTAGQSSMLPEGSAPDAVARRIERARALAAAHQLQTAAVELENVRASTSDAVVRNVTTVMLMGIYLEDGNYGRAQALLQDAFKSRLSQKDDSIRTYFAMAGQAINGVRSHLDRYRSYGINPSDAVLPVEALTDLDRVREFLEVLVSQAKEVAKDEGRSYDALALQEDLLGIRLSLARDNDDREKWQAEYSASREQLASHQVQVASIGRPPALGTVTSRIPNPFASPKPAETAATASATAPPATSPDKPETTATPPSQPAGAEEEPKLISTGSLAGRESKRVSPTYPPMAKSAGVVGTVRVFAIVDEKGKVWVTQSEGPTLLRKAAEDAARKWTFPPTLLSGKPVRVAGYVDFEFKK